MCKGVMKAALSFSLMVRRLLQQECAFKAIQFWFVPTFTSGVYERQRFGEYRETCLWLSHCSICFGEQRQKIGPIELCARRTQGAQALGELLDPFLRLSLVRQGPAAQESTDCLPLRKSLVRGKADGASARSWVKQYLAAERMEDGRKHQGVTYRLKGCATCLRQGHRLATPRQRLGQGSPGTTASTQQCCGTARPHRPHSGTPRRGAAGGRRVPSPA